MKKLFFVFMMTAFAANIFANEGGGCLNRPLTNDGHCVTSTYGGVIHYYCVDPGTQSRDCVKGGDVDQGG